MCTPAFALLTWFTWGFGLRAPPSFSSPRQNPELWEQLSSRPEAGWPRHRSHASLRKSAPARGALAARAENGRRRWPVSHFSPLLVDDLDETGPLRSRSSRTHPVRV